MALIDINWNPSKKELWVFLVLLNIFSWLVAGIVYHRTDSGRAALTIVAVVLLVSVVGFFVPKLTRYLYVVWMAVAFPIGWVVSHLVMACVYYLVITPFALVMRLVGYDSMQRKFDENAKSYWHERPERSEVSRYFRQF